MDALYEAVAHATGDGRNGHARTDDGMLALDVRIPKELFAAGYAACFHSAIKFTAARQKLDVSDSEVSATVLLGMVETGFGLAVELDVHIPNLDKETAERLTADAH